MTAEQFLSRMAAAAPFLTTRQCDIAVTLIENMATQGAEVKAREQKNRREQEKRWEEEQFDGTGDYLGSRRRGREPA
jgi:hypothetical protein